jgi:hypothetical protein
MSNNLRIYVAPRRAPRLPRDHFAMRPQVSLAHRVVRAVVIGASIIAILLAIGRHA